MKLLSEISKEFRDIKGVLQRATMLRTWTKGEGFKNFLPWDKRKTTVNNSKTVRELRGIWSTPSLPSLPCPLCFRMVASDRVLSMGQIELWHLNCELLLWTPSYGREKAGRPARTYIQQLCEDTECSPEDPPEAMNDGEEWWERARDIRAGGTTWWWWWWWLTLNWIVKNTTVWLFKCVKTNDWCLIELLVTHSNVWNHLTVCQQMSNAELYN